MFEDETPRLLLGAASVLLYHLMSLSLAQLHHAQVTLAWPTAVYICLPFAESIESIRNP